MMNEEQITENNLKEKLKSNLQLLIAFGTVIGLVVGVVNFFILTAISPIEKRVVAVESNQTKMNDIVTQFIEVKTDVRTIREDLKDIKSFLNLR